MSPSPSSPDMVPKGFLLSVAQAAIKKPGRYDMALIFAEREAAAAGVFTKNKVKAAPVLLDMKRARAGRGRAVVINSGNANACTGTQGMRDAEQTSALVAQGLDVRESGVFVCSTGVIGVPMPMERVKKGVAELIGSLGKASLKDVARAIMTTDTFPKLASRSIRLGKREGVISGVCKGAGMIHPDMATMLCFIMTDAAVEAGALKAALKEAAVETFNCVTVDGDQSTNDTALVMASGAMGNRPLTEGSAGFKAFKSALKDVMSELSVMVVRDGEGATKVIEIIVKGARTDAEAKKGAMAVANSLLVKTAVYGMDPNWGRIIAALGAAGIALDEMKTDILIGEVKLLARGRVTGRQPEAQAELKGKDVRITADLGLGKASARVLTCDLTEQYIKINAEYTT